MFLEVNCIIELLVAILTGMLNFSMFALMFVECFC